MNSDRPVLLLAETGFIIRNLLLGSFAAEVAKSAPLVVAVQRPDDPALMEVIRGKNIRLIPFPFEPYKDRRRFWRRFSSWDNLIYAMGSARKPPQSRKIQTRLFEGEQDWKVKALYKIPVAIGYVIKLLGLQSWIERMYLENYIVKKPVTQEWSRVLSTLNPSIVVSSMLTHSLRFRCSTDLPVVVAAHKLGLKTCTLVQSWDNLTSKTSVLPAWVHTYFTWSQNMSEELLDLNPQVKPGQVKIVGSPQYDFHGDATLVESREAYCKKLGLAAGRPYILIGTGTARWMPDEMPKMVNLVEQVASALPAVQTVIRLHPKDHGERWKPYQKKLEEYGVTLQYSSPDVPMDKGGFIPPKDFYRDQINVIYHSALVINSSSSLTVDAAIFDKPVICVGYDIQPDALFPEGRSLSYSQSAHFRKLVDTGGVPVVVSEAECITQIKTYLENPALHRNERKRITALVTDSSIENAGLVFAKEVLALAQQ